MWGLTIFVGFGTGVIFIDAQRFMMFDAPMGGIFTGRLCVELERK